MNLFKLSSFTKQFQKLNSNILPPSSPNQSVISPSCSFAALATSWFRLLKKMWLCSILPTITTVLIQLKINQRPASGYQSITSYKKSASIHQIHTIKNQFTSAQISDPLAGVSVPSSTSSKKIRPKSVRSVSSVFLLKIISLKNLEHQHLSHHHNPFPLYAATPFPRRTKGVSAAIGAMATEIFSITKISVPLAGINQLHPTKNQFPSAQISDPLVGFSVPSSNTS